MKNNRKGFTLTELLACIGIIATLGLVIGLSASTVAKNTRKEEARSVMGDVLNAAMMYVELSTTSCNINAVSSCSATVSQLINEGLLDANYLNKSNPLYTNRKFQNTDTISITKSSGVKKASMSCTGHTVDTENVKTYNSWWEC